MKVSKRYLPQLDHEMRNAIERFTFHESGFYLVNFVFIYVHSKHLSRSQVTLTLRQPANDLCWLKPPRLKRLAIRSAMSQKKEKSDFHGCIQLHFKTFPLAHDPRPRVNWLFSFSIANWWHDFNSVIHRSLCWFETLWRLRCGDIKCTWLPSTLPSSLKQKFVVLFILDPFAKKCMRFA